MEFSFRFLKPGIEVSEVEILDKANEQESSGDDR